MRKNTLKERLLQKQTCVGINLQVPSPWLVEMIGHAGFDYVMLDGEHGNVLPDLQMLIIAADAAGVTPIVRVPSHDRGFLLPALETGAGGLQVPMVNTREQAIAIVNETKYAPLGKRGFANTTRAANYGAVAATDLGPVSNREVLLSVQLETQESLENAVEIAQVPGVDMVFIGPSDLAQSMGMPGQQKSERVMEAIKTTVEKIRPYVPVATAANTRADAEYWMKLGMTCFLTSSMFGIRRVFEDIRKEMTLDRLSAD